MKQELSKEQRDIALFEDCEAPLLVKASAGSGKTRILTERVRYLLTEKKDKFFSVLCLTFTNKARDEMKERLSDIPKLQERTFIGNFHEFCLSQIIRKQRHEIGLQAMPHIFDEDDKKKIILEVIAQREDLKAMYDFPDFPKPQDKAVRQRALMEKCLDFISSGKRKLITIPEHVTEWENWNERNTFLYKNYNDILESQNAMDLDGILLYAYRILTERPAVANIYRRSYKYILVDEAQDLNFAQYQILKAICGETHKNVLFVGDPNQAIYAFNGASSDFMLKDFVNDFNAKEIEIEHNFRSSTKVLELAHHIRSNGGMPKNYFEGIREMPLFDNEQEEAAWIIAKIKEWLQKGYYEEKDVKISIGLDNMAVLARNRYVFKELIVQLDADEELKNQYFLRKGSERFDPESQLIKAFDLGLRILVNPSDILHFNQLYQELGLPQNTHNNRLESLLSLNQREDLANEQKAIVDILGTEWIKLKNNPKLVDNALNNIEKLVKGSDFPDEEKLKIDYDIKEFQKLWRGFLKNTPSESQTLANFRYFLALNSIDHNKKGLTLAAVHTVKGLEFDIVFLMGMTEGVLPDYRTIGNSKALAEEQNNAYVAVTRAKKCIYVSYPKSRIMPWGAIKPQAIS
jgi:DNA helicase II / ATP-dependent DNA helicase PcrA